MIRSDPSQAVRQRALLVWKSVVDNTPQTLRGILPSLMTCIIQSLGSSSQDRRQVASKTLGDLVSKLGDRVLPDIIPILENVRHGFLFLGNIFLTFQKNRAWEAKTLIPDRVSVWVCRRWWHLQGSTTWRITWISSSRLSVVRFAMNWEKCVRPPLSLSMDCSRLWAVVLLTKLFLVRFLFRLKIYLTFHHHRIDC